MKIRTSLKPIAVASVALLPVRAFPATHCIPFPVKITVPVPGVLPQFVAYPLS